MRAKIARVAALLLLIVHGLIHLIGPLGIWELAELPEMTGETILDLSPAVTNVLAFAWLAALALFLAAGVALFIRQPRWRWVALGAAVVSQALIVVWWPDASAGTLANALVLGAAALAPALQLPHKGS